MRELAHLNKYFFKYKYRFLLGITFVALSNLFAVYPAEVIRYGVDNIKENIQLYRSITDLDLKKFFYQKYGEIFLYLGVIILLVSLVRGLFMFFMRQSLIIMSRMIEHDLRDELYQHYQVLNQAFYKRNNTGDLMNRITEDVTRVRMYLGPGIMYSINLFVLIVVVVYKMISVSPSLTLYVLIPLPILSVSIYWVSKIINRRSEKIQRQLSHLTSLAQETYSGIRIVKAFVQEESLQQHFLEQSNIYKQDNLRLSRVQSLFFPLMILLTGLSTILTVYLGGIEVFKGKITTGNIAEFVIYVNMLTWPISSLGWVAALIQQAAASQKRLNEFLSVQPDIDSPVKPVASKIKGNITFDNVSFTYPDTGIQALKEVSFEINQGDRIMIVGKTGSGKSTLTDLLVRLYDVSEGTILIDKENITNYDLKALRSQIAYSPQDVFLFSDSVSNNIAFGGNTVQEQDVIHKAKAAQVHGEIEKFSKQYQTLVGERGVTLSGGQKQRIGIARALMNESPILILDDSLSAVDNTTEKNILNALNKEFEHKTVLFITHRIFEEIEFDQILVMDDGYVVEKGKHQELMQRKGIYYDYYQLQKIDKGKND